MIIQVLLVLGVCAAAVALLRTSSSAQHTAVRRLAGVGVAVLGVASVLWPDAVTWLARLVGVGRGTDLVLYAVAVVGLLFAAITSRKLAEMEQRMVVMSRALAIATAQAPTDTDEETLP
jgi:hypothetical protein